MERQNLLVDVRELRVPISMVTAFFGLAVDLAAVSKLPQQLAHRVGTSPVSHRPQRRCQLGSALGNPPQRPHRIAERHRVDQIAQIIKQARVMGRQRPAAAASTTHTTRRWIRCIKILQTTTDRTARNPGRTANRGDTTVSGNPRLARREKPTTPLIKSVPYGLIASSYGLFIDHQHKI